MITNGTCHSYKYVKAYNTKKTDLLTKPQTNYLTLLKKKLYYRSITPDYMKLWRNSEKNIDGVNKCLLGVI